jgi:hypothetical protein
MRLPRIIGTVIPFIGFRTLEVDEGLRHFIDLTSNVKTINSFQLEWLGCTIVFPIRPDDD